MWQLPRIAVGTAQSNFDPTFFLWGLQAALQEAGINCQWYNSQAVSDYVDVGRILDARPRRHLDTWVLNKSACLAALRRDCEGVDLAVATGQFDDPSAVPNAVLRECPAPGGNLDMISYWLDLARIVIVDASRLDACQMPSKPLRAAAILLDKVADSAQAAHWQTNLESAWRVPVLGWLPLASPLRESAASPPAGCSPGAGLCHAVGKLLLPSLRLNMLLQIAQRSPLPETPPAQEYVQRAQGRLQVAVAYDEIFNGYLAESLDGLEASGATLRDFSPLHSCSLPQKTDVVFLGNGGFGECWRKLAANHCVQQSLRSFAAAGGRVYAEGAGLAYLCRQLVLPSGERIPLAGLLPARARLCSPPRTSTGVEVVFGASSWMWTVQSKLRGYRQNHLVVDPTGPMLTFAQSPEQRLDIFGRGNVLGSRLVVDLAAHPQLLGRFFTPYRPAQRLAAAPR